MYGPVDVHIAESESETESGRSAFGPHQDMAVFGRLNSLKLNGCDLWSKEIGIDDT